jgi:hypothetical protein
LRINCNSIYILIGIIVGNCARKRIIERSKTQEENGTGRKRFNEENVVSSDFQTVFIEGRRIWRKRRDDSDDDK